MVDNVFAKKFDKILPNIKIMPHRQNKIYVPPSGAEWVGTQREWVAAESGGGGKDNDHDDNDQWSYL